MMTGEIELHDKTSSRSGRRQLLLDKFVYDPDIDGGAIVIDLVRRSFRFVTGLAAAGLRHPRADSIDQCAAPSSMST